MKKQDITLLEAKIRVAISRIIGKIPEFLKEVAAKAIKIIDSMEDILSTGGAFLTKLFPELEPYRAAIMKVLNALEIAIKALQGSQVEQVQVGDMIKGLYFAAASKIAAEQHNNLLRTNNYNLAVQSVLSEQRMA